MVGISFKIAKTGIKYNPSIRKRCLSSSDNVEKPPEANPHKKRRGEVSLPKIDADHSTLSLLSTTSKGSPTTSEHEASFAVNLFLDGFSVGKPTEQGKQAPSAQELIGSLHHYNRTNKTLFQAINDGWLPGDILEEIPCKYVNGNVMCEVRDYRKGLPSSGDFVSSGEGFPVVQKVLLCSTMENIVKDISSMAESWTYSDLMEIESRILKAVQPKLCLDPTPMLERLCENSISNKLNLEVASPGSVTNSMAPSNVNSPSIGTAPLLNSVTKPDQSIVSQDQKKQLETILPLVSVIQRYGLPIKKKSVEEVCEPKKVPPSWQLLAIALNNAINNEDQKDVKGQRCLSNSLVGDTNVCKTRIMNFVHADNMYPGNSVQVLIHRSWVRLVMCEHADGMVEAVVQSGDDQDEDSLNSCHHDVLKNTQFADRLAAQFSALMEKEGYELVDDQVQPIQQHQQMLLPNTSSITQSMTPCAYAVGKNMNQLPSLPLVMESQNMAGSDVVCGKPPLNSLALSSPNTLAAVQMSPLGNAPNRHISSGFLQSGLGTSKSLELDLASELAAVQQQQHQQHQLQQHQQHQLQQHQQQQLQRCQRLVNPNRFTQLNSASHNPNQQMNSKIITSANQIKNQQIIHRQQQEQQQLQRKSFLSRCMDSNLRTIGVENIGVNNMSGVGMPMSGHNMVGLGGGMSMGMMGINNMSASMGVMPNLTNINTLSSVGGMGQAPGIGNMIEHHIRDGTMNTHTAWDRIRMGRGRSHPGTMMNNPKTSGMHGVTGQSFYLNQQLNNQYNQINSQQLNQQQQLNVQKNLQHLIKR